MSTLKITSASEAPEDLTLVPDFIVRYMAPMACGEKYRAEWIRRDRENGWGIKE